MPSERFVATADNVGGSAIKASSACEHITSRDTYLMFTTKGVSGPKTEYSVYSPVWLNTPTSSPPPFE